MQHNTTKYDPFTLVYGRQAITPLDLLLEQHNQITQEIDEEAILSRISQVIDILDPTLQKPGIFKNVFIAFQKRFGYASNMCNNTHIKMLTSAFLFHCQCYKHVFITL